MKDNSIATTWSVTVPMITNSERVATGEELLLEVTPKPAVAGKRPGGWSAAGAGGAWGPRPPCRFQGTLLVRKRLGS